MEIKEFFKLHKTVAVALSGGVDSAVLLLLAKRYAEKVYACFVKSDFQPEFEQKDAVEICNLLNQKLMILNVDVLNNKNIIANSSERCYFCKKNIFSKIAEFAESVGADAVVEGTNASDDIEDRAGYKALKESGVFSPLRLCGIDKQTVREIARENALPVADKPSYACLATRIPTGTRITKEILVKTEKAENELFKLGFFDFRIRYFNGSAKLQITDNDIERLLHNRKKILNKIGQYYDDILLDLKVRDNNEQG